MFRLWLIVGAVLFALIWNFFIKTMMVLVIVLVIGGGIWAWWEFRQLRKAMRKPPDR